MAPAPSRPLAEETTAHARISRDISRLHAAHYGKGPQRTKTYRDGDLVTVVMRDNLTPVEKTLVEGGRGAEVHALRRAFQDVKRGEMVSIVAEALSRQVETMVSQVSLEPDINFEVFLLVPMDPGVAEGGPGGPLDPGDQA